MQNFLANVRYAFRQFRHSPVFTAAAVVTLALGIGGTTAIFSLIDAVMLRSLPVVDPSALYRVGSGTDCCVQGGPQDEWGMVSYPLFLRLKENLPEFEELTAFQAGGNRMSVRRQTDRTSKALRAEYVTGNYFSTFGIKSFGGRLFNENDDQPSAPPVAVLSYHLWQADYGSDPSVVGSTFVIENHPVTIIGIAPPGFYGETLRGDPPDVWVPLQQEPLLFGAGSRLHQPISAWLRVIGRLKPGATTDGMSARLTTVLRQWLLHDSGYPANWMEDLKRVLPKQTIAVIPAGAGVTEMKEGYGHSLEILLAVCGVVLLIACANVANLLLARSVARRTQTAIRLALGASRREIILQALTESIVLSLIGGIAGLIVAVAASRLLLALAFHGANFLPISTTPSLLVLGFAFALSVVTGMIFGAAPAWFATRTHPVEALRGAGRSTRDSTSFARKALLVVQATLSVVLVAGATMLARSLGNLENQDFGFTVPNRIEVSLNSPPASYTLPQLESLYREIETHLKEMPGIEQEGLALYNPLTDNWGELIEIEGHPPAQFNEQAGASWDRITPGYFSALQQPIMRGRGFTETDSDTSEKVAVVNQAFVKRFFKSNEDPLDKHFGIDLPEAARTYRIVGIVRDAKYAGWGMYQPAMPMFYVPMAQSVHYSNDLMNQIDLGSHFVGGILLVTRTAPGAVEAQLTKMLGEVDPNLTIIRVQTMQQQIAGIFSQETAVASLATLFGIVALLLAAVGLYGVTAYAVAQRTNEIGVRMALGADRAKVVRLILSGAFRRVAIGLLLGIPLAIGAGKLIAAQLYGVRMWDPIALGVAVGALGACAFIASVIPALRAAAISPMQALRIE